nr:ribosome silencing factor [Canibacter zhoujuaniae]
MLDIAVPASLKSDGQDPIALNVSEVFGYADIFMIVSGAVERNVQAIARDIEDELNAAGYKTLRREGRELGRWILLDFGDLIVHVFHEEEREYYVLERLWSDGAKIDLSKHLPAV